MRFLKTLFDCFLYKTPPFSNIKLTTNINLLLLNRESLEKNFFFLFSIRKIFNEIKKQSLNNNNNSKMWCSTVIKFQVFFREREEGELKGGNGGGKKNKKRVEKEKIFFDGFSPLPIRVEHVKKEKWFFFFSYNVKKFRFEFFFTFSLSPHRPSPIKIRSNYQNPFSRKKFVVLSRFYCDKFFTRGNRNRPKRIFFSGCRGSRKN